MSLQKDLKDLKDAGIITAETSDRIRAWYAKDSDSGSSRLMIVFGILGAILVGLGIILVVAHNWDEFSRPVRTFFALLPLAVGQAACLVARLRKEDSVAWREGAGVFLVFAVGASITIVSQIYHLGGDMKTFLLTWTLLCIPIIYLMQSSVTSLLCIAGMTSYAWSTEVSFGFGSRPYLFLLMFAAILPHYIQLFRRSPFSNFTRFHNWFIPLSLTMVLSLFIIDLNGLTTPAFLALFAIFLCVATLIKQEGHLFQQPYTLIGSFGTVWMLLSASFGNYWTNWSEVDIELGSGLYALVVISTIAFVMLIISIRRQHGILYEPLFLSFAVFLVIQAVGKLLPVGPLLVNLLVFVVGLTTIVRGSRVNSLGIMNYGMGIITALIICRFLDTDLSFILRGLLFIGVGAGFFLLNYLTLKNRKSQ